MSRYIEAGVLLRALAEMWYDSPISVTGISVSELIDKQPSIDIVRCAECKYEPICSHSVQHTTHEPTSVTIGYKSVDFCSYGEREGE